MGNLLIHKHIGIEDESSYGSSATGTANRMTVRTANIALNPTKELVEDTTGSVKGRDRITSVRNVVEGDISAFGTPRNLHHLFEMVNGTTATVTTLGTSASIYTYNQNVDGTWLSKTINKDFNNSQEKFAGVVARSIELTASDGLLEVSVDLLGQKRSAGVSMSSVMGETIKPFSFSDFAIYVGRGASANGLTLLRVNEWTLSYENNLEGTYQSGNDNINRVDPGIPSISGTLRIFHDSSTYRDATFGCTEYFIRFDGTLPDCHGLIAGVTPYFLRIDVPRTEFMTNTVNYEQASLAVEEIEFTGMLEPGVSYLWRPQITAGNTTP